MLVEFHFENLACFFLNIFIIAVMFTALKPAWKKIRISKDHRKILGGFLCYFKMII